MNGRYAVQKTDLRPDSNLSRTGNKWHFSGTYEVPRLFEVL